MDDSEPNTRKVKHILKQKRSTDVSWVLYQPTPVYNNGRGRVDA